MMLFTFIVERDGGTYCSQHQGASYREAAADFAEYAHTETEFFGETVNREVLTEEVLEARPLNELVNISCFSHLDADDELWIGNVVLTARSETLWSGTSGKGQ